MILLQFAAARDAQRRKQRVAIYVIEVSFQALKDKSERDYLNELPTSFVLPGEAVDRLRAIAMTPVAASHTKEKRTLAVTLSKGRNALDEP